MAVVLTLAFMLCTVPRRPEKCHDRGCNTDHAWRCSGYISGRQIPPFSLSFFFHLTSQLRYVPWLGSCCSSFISSRLGFLTFASLERIFYQVNKSQHKASSADRQQTRRSQPSIHSPETRISSSKFALQFYTNTEQFKMAPQV